MKAVSAEDLRALGAMLARDGNLESSVEKLQLAVQLDPLDAWGHCLLGATLMQCGEIAQAKTCVERSLRLSPNMPAARWNMALIDLHQENWEAGWAGYEWGFARGFRSLRTMQRQWDGETDLDGRTIWVWSAQGQGDAIQISRYLKVLKERYQAVRIIFEIPKALIWILGHLADETVALSDYHEPPVGWVPGVDEHIDLMSLPDRLKCPIPPPVELRIGQESFEHFQKKFKGSYSVGLSWAGNPAHVFDPRRSMRTEQLEALVKAHPEIKFYSLQRDSQPVEGTESLALEFTTWRETQAAICALDAVISVDTAIAHLTGSCKKPLHLLLSKGHDWRWGDRDDSVWYPNVQCYRQETAGDWDSVIERVSHAIRQASGQRQDSGSNRPSNPAGRAEERPRRARDRKAANVGSIQRGLST